MASMLTVNTLKETMPNYQSRPEDRPKVKTLQVMVARLLLNIFNDPAVLCDARLTALKHVEAGLGGKYHQQPGCTSS